MRPLRHQLALREDWRRCSRRRGRLTLSPRLLWWKVQQVFGSNVMTVPVKNNQPVIVPPAALRRAGFKSGQELEVKVWGA